MGDEQKFEWIRKDLERIEIAIKADIKEVKNSVDALNQFKWKAIGAAIGISFITTVVFQIYATFYK